MNWLESQRNPFSWSHSRERLWAECPRQYYLHYYAPFGGNAPWETTDRPTLYVLGRLINVHTLIGQIVHRLAREGLQSAKQAHLWAEASTVAGARTLLQRSLYASERALSKPLERVNRDATLLIEHYQRREIDTPTALDRVSFYAAKLLEHPAYRDAVEHASDLIAIDQVYRFRVGEVTTYAVPDVVQSMGNDRLRIIDWKTGEHVQERVEVYRAQLALYALFARDKWQRPPEQIECLIAELHTGESLEVVITPDELDAAERRVRETSEAMLSHLRERTLNQAHRDDFSPLASPQTPPDERPEACLYCAFAGECYDASAEEPSSLPMP